jgi:hypothetical protein
MSMLALRDMVVGDRELEGRAVRTLRCMKSIVKGTVDVDICLYSCYEMPGLRGCDDDNRPSFVAAYILI